MRALLAAYHAVAPFDEPLVPDAMRPLIEHKVEQLYARLMQGPVRILTPSRTPPLPSIFLLVEAPPRHALASPCAEAARAPAAPHARPVRG